MTKTTSYPLSGNRSLLPILAIIALVFSAFWLRFMHLGYSDFQGDEIKALAITAGDQSFTDFLLGQRKGPLQWFVTYAYGIYDPDFSNHFLVRLPFAIAGVLSVFIVYALVRLYFSAATAIVASLLTATNGIFVAFGRIVQYQSICILLMLLSLLFLSLAVQRQRWRLSGLYCGAIFGGLALLAHFDAGAIILPASILLYWWHKEHAEKNTSSGTPILHLIAAIAVFLVITASFYLPYLFSVGEYQLSYWSLRMTGAPSNSIRTFSFYNSMHTLIFYGILVIAALLTIKKNRSYLFLFAWILPPLIFTEVFMASPRTHVYTYLVPVSILAALGFEAICGTSADKFHRIRVVAAVTFLTVGLSWSFLVSHSLFVDHDPEYPWNNKSILGATLEGGRISGSMAFPYRRNWQEVGRVLSKVPDVEDARYVTNEKRVIAGFYLDGVMKRYSSRERFRPKVVYVIAIDKPHSWSSSVNGSSIASLRAKYPPLQHTSDVDTGYLPEIFVIENKR